jgi:hypothetical protein
MMKAIEKDVSKQALSSYVGLLSYGNEHELRETVEFYQTVKIC